MKLLPMMTAVLLLAGCGGLFENKQPALSVYDLSAGAAVAAPGHVAATLVVARPRVRPDLDGDRIAVRLADRRFDAYGGARWSAQLPALVESLLVEGLRSSGGWQAVVPARGAFGGRYLLEPEVEAFEADYSAGSGAPTVHVRLRGELGLISERQLLATVEGSATVSAAADRQRDVVAAFESAYTQAAQQLIAATNAAGVAAEAAASH
jgi:ABC-type uncharacterized transport system auxiliary subunit